MPIAPALQPRQRDLQALPFVADEGVGRHAAVLEHDLRGVARMLAGLLLEPRHHVAGRRGGHDEGADAALARRLVGDGHDNGHVGSLAAGDELLDAVEHIAVTVARRGGAQAVGLRAHVRLGETEGPQHLAARQRHQPLPLLRIAGPGHEQRAHGAVVDAHHGGSRAVAGGDLLEDEREAQIVQPRAAPFGGHGHAVAAERGQALQFFLRKVRLAVPARGMRRDVVLHERAHRVLDRDMVFAEQHGGLLGTVGRAVGSVDQFAQRGHQGIALRIGADGDPQVLRDALGRFESAHEDAALAQRRGQRPALARSVAREHEVGL